MITVRSLTRTFDDTRAVFSLDFSVNRGEIFGIVGPDGAGKSTLLRMLATILRPQGGSVEFDGMDAFENSFAVKERIAYMPQRFGLYEDLTVEENIFFFGNLFGMPGRNIREKLPMLYRFSNLEPFRNRLAGKLSGGMKQKLGLACCLVHDPDCILLDEPTNGVDPVSRREFWKILYDLLSGGVTIVVTTAYLDEAERCGRVALMYEGDFIQVGEPAEVKSMVGRPLLQIETERPREAERRLKREDRYRRIIRTGDYLRIFVDNRKADSRTIRNLLTEEGLKVRAIDEIEPSLEDTFVEIIARERESA
jgi:ABC-2 type transport system ATP-binding protein